MNTLATRRPIRITAFLFCLLFLVFTCKKESSEPAAACEFTFNSKTYKATEVECHVGSGGFRSMNISDGDKVILSIQQVGTGDPSLTLILENGLYYYQYSGPDGATFGSNTVSFDAMMEDNGTPAGRVKGTCNCKTGSL